MRTLSINCGSRMRSRKMRIANRKISLSTMPTVRLTRPRVFSERMNLAGIFASRRSIRCISGLRRNVITSPHVTGASTPSTFLITLLISVRFSSRK